MTAPRAPATDIGIRLTELLNILGRTSDAMIAVDSDLRIVGWNLSAERLLGYTAGDAIGRPCHQVLAWTDRCGNAICDETCTSVCGGRIDGIIATREVIGRSALGRTLWLNATTIVPPPEMQGGCLLVHLIREVALPPELERLVGERLSGWGRVGWMRDPRLDSLTPREGEVLRLLAEGLDGTAIAEKLFVSPATVRNHVQHILTKLEVHSRLEAVSLALRGRG